MKGDTVSLGLSPGSTASQSSERWTGRNGIGRLEKSSVGCAANGSASTCVSSPGQCVESTARRVNRRAMLSALSGLRVIVRFSRIPIWFVGRMK